MIINFNIKKLELALQDFYNATDINIQFIKSDFSSLDLNQQNTNCYCNAIQSVPSGKSACLSSDKTLLEKCKNTKQPQMHICHAGLVDIAVPILYDDIILGYIILGQMKKENDFSLIEDYISESGLNLQERKDYYSTLSVFDHKKNSKRFKHRSNACKTHIT